MIHPLGRDAVASEAPFAPSDLSCDVKPLVSAIAQDQGVVFVGAGASIAAGLCGWKEFLCYCLERARQSGKRLEDWDAVQRKLDDQDYMTAAELLQNRLGGGLIDYFREAFVTDREPSAIHRAVASLPFSLAITTNYDHLLERSYATSPHVFTWKEASAFLSAVQKRDFAIVKTHGDVGNPDSLVLTKSHYRDLIHLNDAFNACLRNLLMTRTFLFVGHSLRDHDLLSTIDELKTKFRDGFGPHYAILFEDEVDDAMIDLRRRLYGIETIVCPLPPKIGPDEKPILAADGKPVPDRAAGALKIAGLLRDVGGRVALRRVRRSGVIDVHAPLFSKREACDALLQDAMELTGSSRGDICLRLDLDRKVLYRCATFPPFPPGTGLAGFENGDDMDDRRKIPHDTVTGGLFLRRHSEPSGDFVYISDVGDAKAQLREQGFDAVKYHPCHPQVMSELACPVYSDGIRIGVLNVESMSRDAYCRDHLQALRIVAQRIGSICHQVRLREKATESMKGIFRSQGEFGSLMALSRLLKLHKIEAILYRVDGVTGAMYGHHESFWSGDRNSKTIDYRFGDRSLATRVLEARHTLFVADAREAMVKDPPDISADGVDRYGIVGPVAGFPIHSHGQTAAILTLWSKEPPEKFFERDFFDVVERSRRMAHLIAHDQGRAERWLTKLDAAQRRIDRGKEWSTFLQDPARRESFRKRMTETLLQALLDPGTKLHRVRLWTRINASADREKSFRCTRSFTSPEGTYKRDKPVDHFTNVYASDDDTYIRYTASRFVNDQYARIQHRDMFDVDDRNARDLRKPEGGEWLVAPIVFQRTRRRNGVAPKRSKLFSFVSADSHVYRPGREELVDECDRDDRTFQRFAMDVVTHLLARVAPRQLEK